MAYKALKITFMSQICHQNLTMRAFIIATLGLFCVFCTLKCSSAPRSGASPHRNVEWLQPVEYDFGTVRFGRTVRTEFGFRNLTKDSILLQTVRTTCGCTAAEWPEKRIAPNATSKVVIEFDADQTGDFSKKIQVFFDAQRKAETLWIMGVVE
jgi:hypothetical protein